MQLIFNVATQGYFASKEIFKLPEGVCNSERGERSHLHELFDDEAV